MIKYLNKVVTEENLLNFIKNINKSLNIKLNGERLSEFILKTRTKQECLLLFLIFNIVLKVVGNDISQEK